MRRSQTPRFGGAIAAGHPETTRVGAEILAQGGNAVDACVAAGIASWIAEPTVAGPAGGGFMLVHDPRRASTVAYDFFTAVPGLDASGRPIAPLEELRVEFGTTTQLFLVGPGSCAVPGRRGRRARGAPTSRQAAVRTARRAGDPPRAERCAPERGPGRPARHPRSAAAAASCCDRGVRARGPDAGRGRLGAQPSPGDDARALRRARGRRVRHGCHRPRDRRGPGRRGRPGHRARPARVPGDRTPARRGRLRRLARADEPAAVVRRRADRAHARSARAAAAAGRSARGAGADRPRARPALGPGAARPPLRARALPWRCPRARAGSGPYRARLPRLRSPAQARGRRRTARRISA